MADTQATPRQIAYLEFLGVRKAHTFTKAQADKRIEALSDACSSDPYGALSQRRDAWRTERFRLHLELYRQSLPEFVMLFEDTFRDYVRRHVRGASGKLTKAKVESVVRALLDQDPMWWDKSESNERFFQCLSNMFPDCVDGNAPVTAGKQTEQKPIPPIRRAPRSAYAPSGRTVKVKKRGGCASTVAVFLLLAALIIVVAHQ